MGRTIGNSQRKAKKSYTLSHETVSFLETVRKKRNADSISSVLEEILQAARRQHERAAVDRAVSNYYSALSDKDAEEQRKWGEFALRQLSDEDF